MSRYGHRSDGPRNEIVKGLRAAGWSVIPNSSTGGAGWERKGVPDLTLGGRRGMWYMEVKEEGGVMSPAQKEFHEKWRGPQILVVHSLAEALDVLGLGRA